ncbi:TetR/AcrR family transcriptional regulator [Dactylosporangium vinaceum]|uniref:TetR/AcrR family transcriptional regulator n=1 Tax=Dactylosporangium vinaceum TaxID=53362 RepID=A0ABV5M9T2_9ACTN|nr:TetR/AcrR family transcriptional regulator [Dactylosporangium vinaceum]UAC00083.1 TetR/AcrR family transcriptional regulator [Dactylosporangium vinaceum]
MAPADRSVDARVQRSKATVLAQTYELLSAGGIGGVSIDEVSRRSGVSKTTIYRHWPSRAALLIEACSTIGSAPPVPDTGSFAGDLTALSLDLAEQLRTARWAVVLPSIVDAAEREPELAGLHAELHARLMASFVTVTERAKARAELAPDRDPADVIAAIAGPYFYRRWFSREPLDDAFVEGVVRDCLDRVCTPSPPDGHSPTSPPGTPHAPNGSSAGAVQS